MAEPLTIEIKPADLRPRMHRMGEAVRASTADAIRDAAILAEGVARREAPKDTGALARSITSEVKPLSARVFSARDYATYAELGRRPGARMPPPAALEGFVRRRLGVTGDRVRSVAFLVARAIARRGIKGRFFMRAASQRVAERMPQLLARASERVETVWRAER